MKLNSNGKLQFVGDFGSPCFNNRCAWSRCHRRLKEEEKKHFETFKSSYHELHKMF